MEDWKHCHRIQAIFRLNDFIITFYCKSFSFHRCLLSIFFAIWKKFKRSLIGCGFSLADFIVAASSLANVTELKSKLAALYSCECGIECAQLHLFSHLSTFDTIMKSIDFLPTHSLFISRIHCRHDCRPCKMDSNKRQNAFQWKSMPHLFAAFIIPSISNIDMDEIYQYGIQKLAKVQYLARRCEYVLVIFNQ